jgi:hypothetical protein
METSGPAGRPGDFTNFAGFFSIQPEFTQKLKKPWTDLRRFTVACAESFHVLSQGLDAVHLKRAGLQLASG